MSFRSKLIAALGAALALLAAVGVLSYLKIHQDEKNQGWVEHTHGILELLDSFQTDLTSTGTNQRSYIASGDPNYLGEYQDAVRRLDLDSKQLYKLTIDNPTQQSSLDKLSGVISDRRHELELELTGYEKEEKRFAGVTAAQIAILREQNQRIRGFIADIKRAEEGLLQQRLEAASVSGRELRLIIVSGDLLGLLLLFATSLFVYWEMITRRRVEETLRTSEERFRLVVSGVRDYAIFVLDPQGRVATWNAGAERLNGYCAEEIIGEHCSHFYPEEEVSRNVPLAHLASAIKEGSSHGEGWHIRKDGSHFWGSTVLTALRDESGELRGFGSLTRDMTERKRAEQEVQVRNAQLETANRELESFSYSVSHDLRAPLHSIDGFSQLLLDDYSDRLDATGKRYLERVRSAAKRMSTLIDDLLQLAHLTRTEVHRERVDLSALASAVATELRDAERGRDVTFVIAPGMQTEGDARLLRTVLENLIGNAWKFTSKQPAGRIEVGETGGDAERSFFVRDNGAGFDPAYTDQLFKPFQRLHSTGEFAGSGIGLASVHRIIDRHGGKVWAESKIGEGATFRFTLLGGEPVKETSYAARA